MNTDIDFMKIAEGDKEFVRDFENFVNGKVMLGHMKGLAHNYRKGRYDDRNEWASRLAAEAYAHLIEADLIFDPDYDNA